MEKIIVATQQAYPLFIGAGLLQSKLLVETCAELAREWVIITDDTVKALYAEKLERFLAPQVRVHLLSIPPGEKFKTREVKAALEDQMQALGCGRYCGVIALGGGVITDLAGFVAATYCRGIPAVYIPTTLLAMVDATLGGKTGVNTTFGKNQIGTFTQPRAVIIDPEVLTTLAPEYFVDGVVESIKHALIAEHDFFDFLESHVDKIMNRDPVVLQTLLLRSISIKRQIIQQDEFERGQRALCNFGHTLGHALEAYDHYSLSHGAAVAMGIVVESYLSTRLSGLSWSSFLRIKNCLASYPLAFTFSEAILATDEFMRYFQADKKTCDNQPHFVLLAAIGRPFQPAQGYTVGIAIPELMAMLADFHW